MKRAVCTRIAARHESDWHVVGRQHCLRAYRFLGECGTFCSERERWQSNLWQHQRTLQLSMYSGQLLLLCLQSMLRYGMRGQHQLCTDSHVLLRHRFQSHKLGLFSTFANFVPVAQAWTVAKPTAPAVHPSGYEESSSAKYHRDCQRTSCHRHDDHEPSSAIKSEDMKSWLQLGRYT